MLSRRAFLLSVVTGTTFLASDRGAWPAEDLHAIYDAVRRRLPEKELNRPLAKPPLELRGSPNRASQVYHRRANGVVIVGGKEAFGTGVLISSYGDIITNEHVTRDALKMRDGEWLSVCFRPAGNAQPIKDDFVAARIVRKLETRDLALIRLMQPPPANSAVLPIAAGLPNIGDDVFVIGHPKGYFWSLTQGIVSQIRPSYTWRYDDGIRRVATTIQTQAPINPGNSGGPLLNDEGSVLGIVSAGVTEAQGIFFAIAGGHIRELIRS